MLKKLLLIGFLLFVVAAGVLYFTFGKLLNSGVKSGVEAYGPKITKTEIRLDKVNLSPFSGHGVLSGLYVGNPEGYKSEKAFSLGEIEVSLEPRSVFSDRIVINKIRIVEPQVVFEKKMGTDNLTAILTNIEAALAVIPTEGEKEGKEILLEIKDLQIERGTVTVGLLGQGMTAPLADIHLQNLGSETGGITPEELFKEIMGVVVGNVLGSVGKMAGAVFEGGIKSIEGTVGGVSGTAKEALGGLEGLIPKKRE